MAPQAGQTADRYRRVLTRLEDVRALGVELGLDHVRAALAALGSPDRAFASVQIAGTNGKGSTAAMTEAILRAAGVRTGLFTSPHLARFTERIRIDGHEIDPERLADADDRVAQAPSEAHLHHRRRVDFAHVHAVLDGLARGAGMDEERHPDGQADDGEVNQRVSRHDPSLS